MPPDLLCQLCGRQPVADCLGGSVRVDEVSARECPNLKVLRVDKLLQARLTPQLYEAPKITESPLYTPGLIRGEPARINRTKQNLFIRGVTFGGLLPHLRLVFACLPVKYKIVDDSRIRDVFVGGESYTSKAKSMRDQKESHNVIADLVGKEYDLVVICLGKLGYKNVAAAGVLREALMVRESLSKPTWLFEDSDPTVRWEHSRDMDVEQYIEKRFTTIDLENTGPVADVGSYIVVDGDDRDESPTEHYQQVPLEERGAASLVEELPEDDDFNSMLGGGDSKTKKKTWAKKPWQKKKS